MVIGSGVTNIDNGAFLGHANLTDITCRATTQPTLGSNVFFRISQTGVLHYPAGSDYSGMLTELGSGWTGVTF